MLLLFEYFFTMSDNDQSSAMQNIDVEKEIISDNREKENVKLSNKLIAQLIPEQVKQNELISRK